MRFAAILVGIRSSSRSEAPRLTEVACAKDACGLYRIKDVDRSAPSSATLASSGVSQNDLSVVYLVRDLLFT